MELIEKIRNGTSVPIGVWSALLGHYNRPDRQTFQQKDSRVHRDGTLQKKRCIFFGLTLVKLDSHNFLKMLITFPSLA